MEIETDRLHLRPLDTKDYKDLCSMLQDNEVMYAWEKTFTGREVRLWLERMKKIMKRTVTPIS